MLNVTIIALLALLFSIGCAEQNPDGIHATDVCVQRACDGRAECFDHCVEYSEAGESEEGEDTINACASQCDTMHCFCAKTVRKCVDRYWQDRRCLAGMR